MICPNKKSFVFVDVFLCWLYSVLLVLRVTMGKKRRMDDLVEIQTSTCRRTCWSNFQRMVARELRVDSKEGGQAGRRRKPTIDVAEADSEEGS